MSTSVMLVSVCLGELLPQSAPGSTFSEPDPLQIGKNSLIYPGIQVPEDHLPLSLQPGSKESRSLGVCVYSHLGGEAVRQGYFYVDWCL